MGETTSKKRLTGTQMATLAGVMCVYMCAPTTNIPNVIMTELAAVYPTIDPGLLSYFLTATSIAAMVGAFLFGVIAGKFVKFKTITLIALTLFLIGGVGPMFMPVGCPFWMLLVLRAVLGLALGCFTPMAQSVIISMFEDEKTRSYWLGFGGVFFNIVITVSSTVAGMLALISWQMVFLCYAIGILPLVVFALFFKEPEGMQVAGKDKGPKLSPKEVPVRVWIIMVCFGLAMLTLGYFTSFGRMSLDAVGVDPAIFGTIMSVRTVGSILVAACFGLIYRFLKKYVLVVGNALIAIAFGVFFFVASTGEGGLIPLYIAGFCMGFGMNMLTCGMAQVISILANPIVMTFALGLNTMFMNLGTFCSSPTSQIFFGVAGADPVYNIFILAIVVCVVLAIVNGIVMAGSKNYKAEETAAE